MSDVRLALTGFMGVGKSSVSRHLAHILKTHRIDLDTLIESSEKRSVTSIIDADGVEILVVFLDSESDAGATFRPALVRPFRPISAGERNALVRDVVPRTIMRWGAEE